MVRSDEDPTEEARAQEHAQAAQILLAAKVVRSDEDRAEEARIKATAPKNATGGSLSARVKGRAQAAQEDTAGCLSNRSATEAQPSQGGRGEFFSLLAPGSAAMDDSSLLLDPGSGIALRLIAFSIVAYTGLNVAVFALTPTTRALSQPEHTAVALTLTIQVASLLHDAIARQRISKSERDTHLCIIVVKVLAGLTNALLYALPATPFIVDTVTGRPNSMLRWAEWCVLAFIMTFVVEAIDSTEARTPLLVAASQSLSTLCGLFLPLASALPLARGLAWGVLLVVSFLLFFVIFARLATKRRKLQIMRASLPPSSYPLVRAEVGMRLFWAMLFTWTALTAVWSVDALAGTVVARGATSWCFVADCVIDCFAKALYTTAIIEQVDTATQLTNNLKEARKRSRLHG